MRWVPIGGGRLRRGGGMVSGESPEPSGTLAHETLPPSLSVSLDGRAVKEALGVVASECDLYGHDYQVVDFEGRREGEDWPLHRVPASVFCGRCGLSWKVER